MRYPKLEELWLSVLEFSRVLCAAAGKLAVHEAQKIFVNDKFLPLSSLSFFIQQERSFTIMRLVAFS